MIIFSCISNDAILSRKKLSDLLNSEEIKTTEFHLNYPLNRFQSKASANSKNFPLTIMGKIDNIPIELRVFPISIGYNGPEPQNLIRLLKASGFSFNEEILLDKKLSNGKTIVLSVKKS